MINFKNILVGLVITLITFLYWLLIMTYGDQFRMAHREYRDGITFALIISAIIVNLFLVYLFYSKTKNKDGKTLFLISSPYLLLLSIVAIFSQNIPRTLDIVFIAIGSYLIYEIKKRKSESYKPGLIFGAYLLVVSVSYVPLFNLLENTIN